MDIICLSVFEKIRAQTSDLDLAILWTSALLRLALNPQSFDEWGWNFMNLSFFLLICWKF
jgi:hypothetical protein